MAKTFVTGGSGHVGANLVRELIARGVEVKALARQGSNNAAFDGLDVEVVYGDLRDPASLEKALAGCDRMYHVAAFISIRTGDRQALYDSNVVGTRNVLLAAERAGVERSVVCSSFGAVGIDRERASNEHHTINPFDLHLDYELSKAISEIEVLRAAVRGMDVVIVNPSGVVGPYDFKPSSIGQTILDIVHRKMHVYVPGQFDFVNVKSVVDGHILAMEKGRRGERYILGGELLTLDHIIDVICEESGAPRPRLKLPPNVLKPLSHVTYAFMKRFAPDRPARFTPGAIRLLTSGKRADTTKARSELGYVPRSVDDAFRDQYRWFVETGRARPRARAA